MNFARDVVDAAPPASRALIELAGDGRRVEWTFGDIANQSAHLAGTLQRHGIRQGDVVMLVIGNRSEWVLSMVACFRIGAVALPCTEQLRSKDLRQRVDVAQPALIVADRRNQKEVRGAAADVEVIWIPDESLTQGEPAPAVDLRPEDPCLLTFTSGTSGQPKAVLHGQRYTMGQSLQSQHWLGVSPDDVVWCTAASGWSKSARNVFIAPWLRKASAVLHDARFDAEERLEIVRREGVDILCMAPTEYRMIANRTTLAPLGRTRRLVAAGEALNPDVIDAWREGTGLAIRDGYGQTETGQITAHPEHGEIRVGSMGKPLPGVRAWIDGGELVVDPTTVPTFFLGYLGADPPAPSAIWRTGDRATIDDDGYLFFEGRADDVIISAGYRIGPFEVESALASHPSVADVAVVAAPDAERGSIVRAVVVLHDGLAPSSTLIEELQSHVRSLTAPYKYPRRIDFAVELPRTPSGKLQRALLRQGGTNDLASVSRD